MLSVGGQQDSTSDASQDTPTFNGVEYAKSLPGITGPLGLFDPLGFCSADDVTEGKIKFYREVELKHGRVGMLAALGFLVGENFHPLFGGDIDVPAYLAFQQTPLQTFWPAVVLAIAIPEVFSVFSFNSPVGGQPWSIRSDFENGDLGFDPLGLKPTEAAELKEMQTKELQNGRLGMIAAAGMIAQELASNQKLFMLSVSGQEAAFDGEAYAKELPGVLPRGRIEARARRDACGARLLGWRELPPALRRRHRRAGLPRVPADPAPDVLAGGGARDRDSGNLFGLQLQDTGSVC